MTKLTIVILCDEYMKATLLVVYHMLESIFVTDLANLFTDENMSGRPIRAKYKHFKTICEQTSDNSPTDSNRPNKDEKLCKVALLSCLPIHKIAQRIFEHVLP